MKISHKTSLLSAAIVAAWLILPLTAQADSATSFSEVFSKGTPTLDLRLRQESVSDDNFSKDADALTLRARLGFKTAAWHGVSAVVEAEGVDAINDRYNSTANGNTSFPTVADPTGTEWNQAYLGWDSGKGTALAIGRQRLLLDNHRFFGNVGWRQNEQTFDAISAQHRFGEKTALRYFYIDQANRVFGNGNPNRLLAEFNLDAHLFQLAHPFSFGTLTGYGYLVDNQDLPLTSTQTFGVRWVGARKFAADYSFGYTAEVADQSDYAGGRASNDARYLLLETSLTLPSKHQLKVGFEQLDGDGTYAFQTPFATLHAFNGWADRFLTTPVNGLDDFYLGIAGPVAPLAPLAYTVVWHQFDPSHGGGSYGSEWDAQLSLPFAKHYLALLKYARYQEDGFNRDVNKLWASVEVKF